MNFYKTSLNFEKPFSFSNLKIFCHPNQTSFQNVFKTISISHMFKIYMLLKIWVEGLLVDEPKNKRCVISNFQVFEWVEVHTSLMHFPEIDNRKLFRVCTLCLYALTLLFLEHEDLGLLSRSPLYRSITRKFVSELIRDDVPFLKSKWEGYICCLQPTIPNTNEKCNCRQTKSHPRGPLLN